MEKKTPNPPKRRERTVLEKKGPPGERDKTECCGALHHQRLDLVLNFVKKNHPEILIIDSSRSVIIRYMRGPSPLVYREEERHRALGRDATFTLSGALTHPPRCNRARHRDRHLVSDFVGPPSWISRRGGRHLRSEVVGAAILDLTS